MTPQEILKAKSDEFNTLTGELASLKKAEQAAKEQLTEAQESVAEFDSVPTSISKWRAKQLKSGGDTRKLPDDLQKKQAAKQQAFDELELARGTLETITDDVANTKRRLDALQPQLTSAAIRMCEAFAESAIAEELIELKLRVYEREQMLVGLTRVDEPGRLSGGHYNDFFNAGATERIQTALGDIRPGGYPPNVDPVDAMADRWKRKVMAIMADPNTPLDDLKPVLPSDYQS